MAQMKKKKLNPLFSIRAKGASNDHLLERQNACTGPLALLHVLLERCSSTILLLLQRNFGLLTRNSFGLLTK